MAAAARSSPAPATGRAVLKRIMQNSAWLYGAEIAWRALAAVLLVAVARSLGPTETGKYVFVSSLLLIAAALSDFGTSQYVVRSLAHDRSRAAPDLKDRVPGHLFWVSTAFRMTLTIGLSVAVAVYAASTSDAETRALLLLGAVALPVTAAPGVLAAVLRAQERMQFEALAKVLTWLITLIVGGAMVLAGYGIVSLGWVGILAALIALVFYLVMPRRHLRLSAAGPVRVADLRTTARGAWPFFSTGILVVVYSRLDTILLQQLLGPGAVGEYGVAVRVMEILLVVPGVLSIAIFPFLAKEMRVDPALVLRQATRSAAVLVVVAVPVALLGAMFAAPFFTTIFGRSFTASGEAFRVLVWTIVPVFGSVITSSIIAASRKPIVNTYLAAAMVVICVVGNLLLVPRLGLAGAAIVRLVTEISGFIGGAVYLGLRFAHYPQEP